MRVIYLEPDDEITTVVEKLRKYSDQNLALSVPKGATLLQSIVNLKLLRKEAEELGKQVVIVTTDRVGTTLAEKTGLKTVESTEELPKALPRVVQEEEEASESGFKRVAVSNERLPYFSSGEVKKEKSSFDIGRKSFAGASAAGKKAGSKLKYIIPVVVVVLAVAIYLTFLLLPKAKITLFLKGESFKAEADIHFSHNLSSVDQAKAALPSRFISKEAELSKSAKTTGKMNVGTKATGTITISNKTGVAQPLSASTKFLSSGAQSFLSDKAITVPGAYVDGSGHIVAGSAQVSVTAAAVGTSYNISAGSFTIPALPADKQTNIYGTSSKAMSGGDERVANVVSQTDYDDLKNAILLELRGNIQDDIKKDLQSGEIIKPDIQKEEIIREVSEPALNGEGDSFKLTIRLKISAAAFKQNDLEETLSAAFAKNLPVEQEVLKSSLTDDNIKYLVKSFDAVSGEATVTASGSPKQVAKIDDNKIKETAAGKREKDAKKALIETAGIQEVEVSLSPFFAYKVPKNTAKITVEKREK